MKRTNTHHKSFHLVKLGNIDVNVMIAALDCLANDKRYTDYTRKWAMELNQKIQDQVAVPETMRNVLPK